MKKVFKLTEKMKDFSISLNKTEFNYFLLTFEDFLSTKEIEELQINYASKSLIVSSLSKNISYKKEKQTENLIKDFYSKDINKINYIIQNNDLIAKINGLKIIFYGETGTGKTTTINQIIEMNSNVRHISINFTNLISSKMGQTQINLMNLAETLNNKEEKIIIFLDELDSIVTKRINSDLGEHSRIIATFIKFLDSLSPNIIFIAATNIIDNIDDSILRRFTLKMETSKFDLSQFFIFLRKEGFLISKQREKFLLKRINEKNNGFSFADLKNYINLYHLDSELDLVKVNWTHFLKYFIEKFSISRADPSLSERDKKELGLMLKGVSK